MWHLTLLVWQVPAIACAQGNDAAAPAGGRATLMGNTGVALGRDGAAPFYNPATIVRIRDERLAFAVNFYSLTLSYFPSWHQPQPLDPDRFGTGKLSDTNLLDINFRPLPSTLCLFFTLEDLTSFSLGGDAEDDAADDPETKRPTGKKLAFCFATLESDDFDVQAIRFRTDTKAGPSSHVQSLLRRWSRTYVGPTYSVSLSRRFAVGGSLQVVYSYDSFGIRSESVSSQLDSAGVSSALSTAGSGRSFELTGMLGATYRAGRITMGVSLRLPSLHVYGDYEGTFTQSYNGGGQAMTTLIEGGGSLRAPPPTRVAVGVGVALDRLTLELDGALDIPIQKQLTANLNVTTSTLSEAGVEREQVDERYSTVGRPTFNPSIGLEYYFTAGLSLLAGLSTNFSSLKPLQPARSVGNLVHARINQVAASLGLGSYWSGGELLFGVQAAYGWGQAMAVNPFVIPNDWSVVDVKSYNLLFIVSGATNLNSILRVMNTIANGGQPLDSDKPAQTAEGVPTKSKTEEASAPVAPTLAPAAASGAASVMALPPNPDAQEAEGLVPDVVAAPVPPAPEAADAGVGDAPDAGPAADAAVDGAVPASPSP